MTWFHWKIVAAQGTATGKLCTPTVVEWKGRLLFTAASNARGIWMTDDPGNPGEWNKVAWSLPENYDDPDLFVDDDMAVSICTVDVQARHN